MEVPESTNLSGSSRTAGEILMALRSRERSDLAEFKWTLGAAGPRVDIKALLAGVAGSITDPSGSALLQSHIGTLAVNPLATPVVAHANPEEQEPLKVTGISGASPTLPFSSGPFLQPDAHLKNESDHGATRLRQYPPVAGAEHFSAIYDALQNSAGMTAAIGTSLDMTG